MLRRRIASGTALAALVFAVPAMAGFTFSYQLPAAPTYSTTLNFDEVGGPTGSVAPNAWQVSHGVTSLQSGAGNVFVGDLATLSGLPWLGTGNAIEAPFGVFMNLDNDVTEFSAQIWDNSGPATFIGGGMGIWLLKDGAFVAGDDFGAGYFVNSPTFNATGPTWLNITTDAGSSFDEIRILGFGFVSPTTYMDNASWNAVPEPSALALLALSGVALARRRR